MTEREEERERCTIEAAAGCVYFAIRREEMT